MSKATRFLQDEAGTVGVDWVILSAGAIAMASAVGVLIDGGGAQRMAQTLNAVIEDAVDNIGAERP